MFAKERQDKIYEMIKINGAVTVAKLVELFGVSIETIRRDLLSMEKNRLLTRVHGGAVAIGEMKPYSILNYRNEENILLKEELSRAAAEFVSEGDFIAIDSGSTAIFFAEALKKKFTSLTVITHSTDVFEILRNHESFSVILCGGHYMKDEHVFYGPLTIDMIRRLHIKKAFIFPAAISMEFGICEYQQDLYMIQQELIKHSDNIYILADSSKFENRALLKISDMKQEYYYITDSQLPDELVKLYSENKFKTFTGRVVNK